MTLAAGMLLGGKYRLLEAIGEGGMGSVWRAQHVSLGRMVAIKFVRPEMNTAEVASRFLREARATAAVQHRNVVEVIDVGTTGEGLPYLVMEYLEGETLEARLARSPALSVAELGSILAATLNGLAVVHEAGIIHRDLKPANIFLTREAEGTLPKIVDFGISRATLAGADSAESRLTVTGSIVGTPFYMSPEQLRGAKDIDARTDLYAMGVILYEALTGRLPFLGETIGAIAMSVVTEKCPPVADLRPEVGQGLSDLVGRSLSRDREQRFETARQMRQALLDALSSAGEAVLPRPERASLAPSGPLGPASQVQVAPPAARSRRAVFLLGGVGIGAALLVAGLVVFRPRGDRPSRTARVTTSLPPAAAVRPVAPVPTVVRLHGVPRDATVRVDGVAVSGSEVPLDRDGRVRRLEVEVPGRIPWRMDHVASADADYQVELPPVAQKQPVARPTGRRHRRTKGRTETGTPFVDDPGY